MKAQVTLSILLVSLATSYGSRSLQRKLGGNNCQDDLKQLEENEELATSHHKFFQNFSSQLRSSPKEYCVNKRDSNDHVDCTVNFDDFTSEYLHICENVGAKYEPVTVFMECSTKGKDLEMELINMPTCLSKTCDGEEEIRTALPRALKMYESSFGSEESSCQFFHRTIEIRLTTTHAITLENVETSFNDEDTSGTRSPKKSLLSFAALMWSVIFFVYI